MPPLVRYKIKFPVIELSAIHAREAKEDALDYFKDHLSEIEWEEVKID